MPCPFTIQTLVKIAIFKMMALHRTLVFRLTKCISNSRKVLEIIPPDERAKEMKNIDLERSSLPVERALGVQWNTETDQFRLRIRPN